MGKHMAELTRTIHLGTMTITLINIGELQLNLAEDYRLAEKDWPPNSSAIFGHPLRMPIQCVLLQTPQTCLLVDAPAYDISPDSRFAIPGYQPPPGLLARLAERGVKPDEIDQVVITHAHFDHFSGVTEKHGDSYQPCFPKARYYVGLADWESADMQKALGEAHSLASRTFGVLHREGLLEPISGNVNLTSEIKILAAPGETPGHQIVRVFTEGQAFYGLGDLYHHPIEVEHPEWMSYWADAAANRNSRQRLVEAALAENALLSAAHIPTIGRLKRTDSGVMWDAQELQSQ
jgi:glyoxylase-like metal-dependent hydrolase (beta-lactamase superfamily II)